MNGSNGFRFQWATQPGDQVLSAIPLLGQTYFGIVSVVVFVLKCTQHTDCAGLLCAMCAAAVHVYAWIVHRACASLLVVMARWPSGLRRYVQVVLSSEARVQISPLSVFCVAGHLAPYVCQPSLCACTCLAIQLTWFLACTHSGTNTQTCAATQRCPHYA